jgi:zinc protease
MVAHLRGLQQLLDLQPAFRMPRYDQQRACDSSSLGRAPGLEQSGFLTGPSRRSQEHKAVRQTEFFRQLDSFAFGERRNLDSEFDIPGGEKLRLRHSQSSETRLILSGGGQDFCQTFQHRTVRETEALQTRETPIRQPGVEANHRDPTQSGLMHVLGPAFAFSQNHQIRLNALPCSSRKEPPINWEVTCPDDAIAEFIAGELVSGAGGGGEINLDSTYLLQRIDDWFNGEHFTDADCLEPDAPDPGALWGKPVIRAETMGEFLTVSAASPHAQKIIRREHDQTGKKKQPVEPEHRNAAPKRTLGAKASRVVAVSFVLLTVAFMDHLLRMPHFLRLLGFLLLLSGATAALPFPQETSDLVPDPTARFGRLPNGLRYVIYPNVEPKGRASLRLLVKAGSLNETDEQRGLAHFLEHMAFNGSTHYAPGTLVEFFQRMGMSFGGDTNASTGFDRTVYLLELPDVKPATLAEGLQVFADYAGGLLLEPSEIDQERGIILSEKRTRDSVGFRTFVAQFEFLLGGTLFPQRIPIGTEAVIQNAPREQFVDFYNAWYRPELMSVVVVGDIDPELVERQITHALAPIQPRGPDRPAPDRGRIAPAEKLRVLHHFEAEAPGTTVSIFNLEPMEPETDNAANRIKDLPRTIATAIINRRLSILAKREGAPFVNGRIGVQEAFDFFREASIDLTCKADQWPAALAVADQELRRALEYGFQPAELKEVVAEYLNGLEQAVKTASTRHSSELADEIVDALQEREVFTSPEADLALFKPAIEKVTVEDCLAGLRQAWDAGGHGVSVTGNAKIEGDAVAIISAAFEQSRAVAVTPNAATEDLAWGYTDFGVPGEVVKREHVEDLDLELITFSNGVRLNLKRTPFEAGMIRLSARVGNGTVTQPPELRGLSALAAAAFDAGGLGKHSTDDLRRILAGRNVGVRFNPETDAFVFRSSTTPADLLLDLQLLTAKMIDPGYRPEALRQVQKGMEQLYLSFKHTTNGPMAMEVANLLASGDPRFGLPAQDVLLSRNLEEVRTWLTPELTSGFVEVAVVGDIVVEDVIAAAAKTVGALPKRGTRLDLTALRQVKFPAPFTREYTIDSEIPKGLVAIYWPTTDESDIRRTRRLNVLTSIFSDRLRVKVREELGGTYSPRASSFTSDTFPGYGYISASVDVEPAMAGRISDMVIQIADDLARNGISDDELLRAKQPLLTAIRESVRDNGYWLGAVLSRAQQKPEVLDWARSRTADIEGITSEDLKILASTYLPQVRASRVTVLPTPKS